MKEHPQSAILRAIADGKMIEWKLPNKDWKVCENPLHFIDDSYVEFRIKSETLIINGHEVPCPVLEALEDGREYWYVSTTSKDTAVKCRWSDHTFDKVLIKRGLIHLTEEAAIAHAEALLSFTRSDK